MAAGLGFKTFNTGDVLTAADTNGYLMQGVWVFASAAARTSAVTSPQEGNVSFLKDTNSLEIYDGAAWVAYGAGDITGVTAGTGISGGGTAGTVTITNDMATTITAAGDIVVGTGSGTYDNLPIGSTGQVLTADTTVSPYKVKWASAGGGDDMPAFRVTNNATQSITALTWTKITFQTETFDTNNNFASSRFTPTVEGYYQINASIKVSTATRSGYFFTMYKNGSADTLFDANDDEDGSTEYYESGSGLVYLNGSTDYVEMYLLTGAASTVASGSSSEVRFTGAGVRKA